MLRRFTVLLAGIVATSAAIVEGGAVAANERGIVEGWVESHPVNAMVDAYIGAVVSADLSTAVVARCDERQVVFVDLATGDDRVVAGTPAGDCSDRDDGAAGDIGPLPPRIADITADGRALVSAPWEGVQSGDTDGGETDVFLVDGTTGERLLLSADLGPGHVVPLAVSADGDRVVLSRTDATLSPVALVLWDRGAVTPIVHPALSQVDWTGGGGTGNDSPISDDGRYFFTPLVTNVLLRIDLDSGATTSIPMNAACCGLRMYAVSSDGESVAWFSTGSEPDRTFTRNVTIWSAGQTVAYPFASANAQTSSIHVAAGKVFGSAREFVDGRQQGYRFWSIDIATGEQTNLIDEGPNGGPFMRADAVADDGRRAVISTMGPNGYQPADPRILQGGRLATWQYEWDADRTPPGRPGSDPTVANRVERLYRAFLLRSGDENGLAYWVDRVVGGAPISVVADSFVVSAEFEQRYGNLDDLEFVELLYRNVFDRQPDLAGAEYWLGVLASGVSRGTVVTAISDSAEFIASTGTLAPRPGDEAALRRLYTSYFLREADASGLDYWLDLHRRGLSLEAISQAFAGSDEFDDLYGAIDEAAFIAITYMNVFGRYPDAQGNSFWSQELRNGVARSDMMLAFSQSTEFVDLTTSRAA